jgi:signal transduction histidine kinase
LFLPLKIRNHTIGVLEVYGSEAVADRDVLDSLLNMTTEAASALENARLYGQLAERERQLQEVVGRLLSTQEEERRRIAYEVHDGPTQMAVGAYQHLQAFANIYPPDTAEGRHALDEVVELMQRTIKEAREVIAKLRPAVLDEFGFATALRFRDWGVGFTPDSSQKRGPGERVGLAGMRERVALVGGKLRIYSKEGTGSLVMADIPLLGDAALQDFDLVFRLNFTGHRCTEDSDA